MASENSITIGTSRELKDKLLEAAKKEGRTLSALIKNVLEVYLSSVNDTQPDVDLAAQVITLMQQMQSQSENNKQLNEQYESLYDTVFQLREEVSYLKSITSTLNEKVQNQ
jgi:predicted DNA-binding protein